jgi:hypothetical protein
MDIWSVIGATIYASAAVGYVAVLLLTERGAAHYLRDERNARARAEGPAATAPVLAFPEPLPLGSAVIAAGLRRAAS